MLLLSNMLSFLSDNFNKFYNGLNETGKLVFWIVIILVAVLFILLIIVMQQRSIANRLEKQYIRNINVPEPSVLETSNIDIDLDNEKTRNLKEITDKLQAVIDSKAVPLTNYEEDQEESSIISYKELIKKNETQTQPLKDNPPAPIKPQPIYSFDEKPKFKSSEFISPIFGVQEKEKPIKNDLNNNEIKKNVEVEELDMTNSAEDDYLNSLKQFRKNLN